MKMMEEDIMKDIQSIWPYYQPCGQEVAVFEHAYENRLPVLLKGPTGSGKSRFVEFMAAKLEKTLITVSCHEETAATDLIGRYIIQGTDTRWVDGPLTTAMKTGSLLYLDEIAEARPDVMVVIHPLTDHRRTLFIDKLGMSVQAHPDFMLVASYNPGYQRGYKEMKPSTRQRFIALSFHYPEASLEADILVNESGVDAAVAKKLVHLGGKIRNLKELGLTETVSTRLLVDAARLIHSGLPPRLSVHTAVLEPLTDEEDVLRSLSDLVNLMI